MQKDDHVSGPMNSDEVRLQLQNKTLQPHHMIWGPGVDGWQNLQSWLRDLPNMGSDPSNSITFEAWHYAFGGQSHGPLSRDGLLNELKNLPSVGDVMLWTQGMKEWAPLFEFHDVLNSLGVNRRQFPRADLTGQAVIKLSGDTMIAPLLSISEGGCGVTLETGLVAGQSVTLELKTAVFREVIYAKADVRYAYNGTVGFKFTHMSMESKGAIIQFIKQNQITFALKAA